MTKQRASIFDGEPHDLDLSAFEPKPIEIEGPCPEAVRAVSESASFHSREPSSGKTAASPSGKRKPRIHRTGRNQQINVKAKAETVEAFHAISDRKGWKLSETLEHGLAALQRELNAVPL